jgi:hypothetical protein
LVDLLATGAEPGSLVPALQRYGARARSKFTGLLRSVSVFGSGLGVTLAPQEKPVRTASLTAPQVAAALAAIDAVEPTERFIHVSRGILQGSNTRRGTFDLHDLATGNRYVGKVSSDAQRAIDGLRVGTHSYVAAEILEVIAFGSEDQETGRKYTLLSIQAITAD